MIKTVFKKKYLTLFLLLSILVSSCSSYKQIEVGEVKSIKLEKLSGDGVYVNVMIPIKNENSYPIKIKSYNLDIALDDYKVGNVSSNEKIKIEAKSEQVYKIPVKIKFNGLFSSSGAALFRILKNRKLNVKIKGSLKAGVFFVTKKIKINEKKTVNILK